ncbi:MAG TPA: polyribonucleotide nucleotidyltransferase [Chitinophagales bacterium]|nr:polyribonucleotide nucleotidyltransferase [Chitinophagales bacterium]HMU97674.1 polyribonucleotide nucleotidyltransferase [Chitinophagales bacterium]HMV01916.1 polyribonucleotide nucleotidyltransferase [Chitinophagales bacterium]HMW93854.1 polyribonucleotide nucleotidyltransferase [Chitinophagales bacterium]HMY42062.1 polyribonucleotide nucleotidyltransferase [Chitinophagales bacterium]
MIQFNIQKTKTIYNNGQEVTIETGKLARQADGAVVLTVGKCMILATVCASDAPKEGVDFFPLTVDYQEKFSAAGRIPGSFHRREAKLSDYEVLISRLVDRAIRPMFADNFVNDTQVLISLISSDETIAPDTLVGLAASAALSVSSIPFEGPISEVRVIKSKGEFIVNPLVAQMEDAELNIILAGTLDNILMVEGEAAEASEADLIEAIKTGHAVIKQHCEAQLELQKAVNKAKREVPEPESDEDLYQSVKTFAEDKIKEIAKSSTGKAERKAAFKAIKEAYLETISEEAAETFNKGLFSKYYAKVEKNAIRHTVLDDKIRLDGRKTDEIRPLSIEVDVLPTPHGSALFTRGETQSLSTVTLGSKQDEQMLDKAESLTYAKFLLHYNFPPFSTGEVKPMRGTSRREVGHGNLALRSLKQMMPADDTNPYTVRIVSDILESNGSSSMATVCAGSLALMDAGIPFKKLVSGIAMGMIAEDGKYAILSDILGDEDHLGDMDFKVTGTKDGICGVQMDLKVDGLSYEVLAEALEQARKGRLHILNAMEQVIAEPRPELKPHVPRAHVMEVPKEFIGAIIGPGGKIIQEIQEKTNTTITIEEFKEKGIGQVIILSNNKDNMNAAINRIKGIVAVPEVGEVYEGKVKSILAFGAFVEFMPGKDGLLHISEVSHKRLENLDGIIKEGDIVQVKLIGIDPKTGKFKLSRKVLINKNEEA